ncbi:MAG: thioesterase family protein [Planctomycetaceae bacterium]
MSREQRNESQQGEPQSSQRWTEVKVRVRYCETDAMGYLHHGHYINYFEMARTEVFREAGGNYRQMEERGFFLVVVKVECHYKQPARYDDVLMVRCRLTRQSAAKLEHEYEVWRDETLLTTGHSTLACVDRQGEVQRLTDELLFGP